MMMPKFMELAWMEMKRILTSVVPFLLSLMVVLYCEFSPMLCGVQTLLGKTDFFLWCRAVPIHHLAKKTQCRLLVSTACASWKTFLI